MRQKIFLATVILVVVLATTLPLVTLALYHDHGQDNGGYTIVKADAYLDEVSGSAFSQHGLYVKSFGDHIISGHFVLITDSRKQVYVFFPHQNRSMVFTYF